MLCYVTLRYLILYYIILYYIILYYIILYYIILYYIILYYIILYYIIVFHCLTCPHGDHEDFTYTSTFTALWEICITYIMLQFDYTLCGFRLVVTKSCNWSISLKQEPNFRALYRYVSPYKGLNYSHLLQPCESAQSKQFRNVIKLHGIYRAVSRHMRELP